MARSVGSLEKVLSGAQLAALPQSAIRLLELSQDPDNGPAEYVVPIEADPGLTGQVLRFVNSSYFGFSREISSVKLALTLVGVRTIKNFVLWNAVFSLMPNPKCGPFDLRSLWQDSLRRGLFARLMGRTLRLDNAEDLFAAALLQDMAVPMLAKEFPEKYVKLLLGREEGRVRLSQLEMEEFGWTHAEAAGRLARGWSLSDDFAKLVELHSHTERLTEATVPAGIEVVALSSVLPSSLDPTWHDRDLFLGTFERFAGTGADLAEVFRQVDAGLSEFAPVLKLPAPSRPLVDCLQVEVA